VRQSELDAFLAAGVTIPDRAAAVDADQHELRSELAGRLAEARAALDGTENEP
jgi:hypothetical protein